MDDSIKQKLYKLIEETENESLLKEAYELIYKKKTAKEGDLWNKLSPEQQNELLAALEESANPENLIPSEEVKKLLDERLAKHKANPKTGDSWENVKKRIKGKL